MTGTDDIPPLDPDQVTTKGDLSALLRALPYGSGPNKRSVASLHKQTGYAENTIRNLLGGKTLPHHKDADRYRTLLQALGATPKQVEVVMAVARRLQEQQRLDNVNRGRTTGGRTPERQPSATDVDLVDAGNGLGDPTADAAVDERMRRINDAHDIPVGGSRRDRLVREDSEIDEDPSTWRKLALIGMCVMLPLAGCVYWMFKPFGDDVRPQAGAPRPSTGGVLDDSPQPGPGRSNPPTAPTQHQPSAPQGAVKWQDTSKKKCNNQDWYFYADEARTAPGHNSPWTPIGPANDRDGTCLAIAYSNTVGPGRSPALIDWYFAPQRPGASCTIKVHIADNLHSNGTAYYQIYDYRPPQDYQRIDPQPYPVDQRANRGQWFTLGTWTVPAGSKGLSLVLVNTSPDPVTIPYEITSTAARAECRW